jgi:hypothetical protein
VVIFLAFREGPINCVVTIRGGYFNDETAFQPEAGECYNEAVSAVKGKIILTSSSMAFALFMD